MPDLFSRKLLKKVAGSPTSPSPAQRPAAAPPTSPPPINVQAEAEKVAAAKRKQKSIADRLKEMQRK